MKKRLLTHMTQRKSLHGYLRKLSLIMTIMMIVQIGSVLAQGPTYGRLECACLDNASTTGNGQFRETVIIFSDPGETWTIVGADGFYDIDSPDPPAEPEEYPSGTLVPEVMPGEYRIDGRRVEGTTYTITFMMGGNEFEYSSTDRVCNYPNGEILGDAGICDDSDNQMYSVDIATDRIIDITWDLPSGGTIVSGQGTNTIVVDWDDMTGTHTLSVAGEARAYDGQPNNFCDFDGSTEVVISDEISPNMACNNNVNLSINNQCELTVNPNMFLEDMQFNDDSYEIEIVDMNMDTLLPGNVIGMEYLDITLQVSVIHECSGNLCWGFVTIEDKSMPSLECPDDTTIDCGDSTDPEDIGFPVPDSATVTPVDGVDNTYIASDFDGCSDVTLFYSDRVESNLCDGPFGSTITRTWRAEDTSGNVDTCSSRIFINRGTLDDIMFPENYDDQLGTQPSLYACDDFPTLDNGNPDPEFTGMPTGTFCLNVEVSFEDERLDGCSENSFKVRRRWSVTDVCNDDPPVTFVQTITVADNVDPVVTVPESFTASTNALSCEADIDVPVPMVEECSEWDYTVAYKAKDDSGDPYSNLSMDGVIRLPNDQYRILEAEGDTIIIVYTVIDECDNVMQDFTEAIIIDDEKPVPVCDLTTFIGLTEDGTAFAGVDAFDDGSYDNCELDKLEIRRMESSACGVTSVFGEEVKFCCDDVGSTVMVRLRATDSEGNVNECMVEAIVQDNKAPEFTFCPADVTVDCESNLTNYSIFGTAVAEDNCSVTVVESSSESFTSCGSGTITRTFVATDDSGQSSTCTQTITVTSLTPFGFGNIDFPNDYTTNNGCPGLGIAPEMLPPGFDVPKITADPCAQLAVDYEDVVFQFVDGYCFKVLRTWTVFDECQFDPMVPGSGEFTDTQIIQVRNTVAPTFIVGCDPSAVQVSPAGDCLARLEITAIAQDDCDQQDIEYSYEIDLDNNGSVDISAGGNSINRVLDYGLHRVTFFATDECDNTTSCSQVVEVRDDKAPTPYCLGEVVTTLNEDGIAEIWASDFDNGSYDECIGNDNVIIAFDEEGTELARTYNCDSLSAPITELEVMIWVIDTDGNADFCTSMLKIQDNFGLCDFDNLNRVEVTGQVMTEGQESIGEVQVMMMDMHIESPIYDMTDDIGAYAFDEIVMYHDYYIEPSRSSDYREGVSTLDLVLIQRHILGFQDLDSPYKLIAADINNSASVSSVDIVQLRKLVLGIYDELPDNSSWRFVDAQFTFADSTDPWPFAEKVDLDQLDQDESSVDFIGVKIGDVNGSYQGANAQGDISTDNRSQVQLEVTNQDFVAGDQVIVDLIATQDMSAHGMQMSMTIDPYHLSLIDVQGAKMHIADEHIGLVSIDRGQIDISYDATLPVDIISGDIIAQFRFIAQTDGSLADYISIDERGLSPEIYLVQGHDISTASVSLQMINRDGSLNDHTFSLMQNVPNPFENNTTIGFTLPHSTAASLKVFDTTGRLLWERQDEYQKGYNQVILDINDIEATGILYYQLDTNTHSASKKMIVLR